MTFHGPVSRADVPDVIRIESVSKVFTIRRDNSLKERIVTLGRRGRAHQEKFVSLQNVSLSVPAGVSIGLMGPNGSGKSTLLKLIGGIIDPTTGVVRRRGRLAALLELGAGFHPDLSGRDNVYLNASILGLSRQETNERFESILAFSEIGDFIDTQVKFYSSGMYVRLAFAVAVHTDPDILLVDEVLAVGDEAFQRKCMDKIRQFQREGRTIVLVSHSAAQVMEVCDQGVVLSNGEVAYMGSAADATRVHRELLEGKRKVAEDGDAEDSDETDHRPSISAMRVMVGEEEKRDLMRGEGFSVVVDVDVPVAVDRWHSSVSIDTPHGQQVFGTGTRRLETHHGPTGSGHHELRYEIRDPHFAGGQYFVNAEISGEDGTPFDIRWQGAMFFVPMDERQTGTVFAEADIAPV